MRVMDKPVSPIEAAIMHAAQAGKLRAYVRKSGSGGLNGLVRLAERHSAISAKNLDEATKGERS